VQESSPRRDDVFGRFGGEEFLLVMPHTTALQGLAAAEKVRGLIAGAASPSRRSSRSEAQRQRGVGATRRTGSNAATLLRRGRRGALRGEAAGPRRVLQASGSVPVAVAPAREGGAGSDMSPDAGSAGRDPLVPYASASRIARGPRRAGAASASC